MPLIVLWLAAVLLHRPLIRFLEQIAIAATDIPLLHGLIVIGLLGVLIWIPAWTYKMIEDLEEPTQGVGMVMFIMFFALPAWLISLFILKVFWGLGFWLIVSLLMLGILALLLLLVIPKTQARMMRWVFNRKRRSLRARR